jgi:hypothetical protein
LCQAIPGDPDRAVLFTETRDSPDLAVNSLPVKESVIPNKNEIGHKTPTIFTK